MSWLERLSFQTKITFITLIMILLVVVVAWGGIHFSILPAMEQKIQDDARHLAGSLATTLNPSGAADPQRPSVPTLELIQRLMPNLAYVEIADSGGTRLHWFGDQRFQTRRQRRVLADQRDGVLVLSRVEGGTVYEVSVPLAGGAGGPDQLLRVGLSTDYITHLRWQLFYVLSVVTLFVLVSGFVCTRWFSVMITRPVDQLLHLTQLLAQGKLEEILKEFHQVPAFQAHKLDSFFSGAPTGDRNCPLFDGRPVEAEVSEDFFPYLECRTCDIRQCAGKDELMRLLLAFRFMAVEVRRYREQLHQRYQFEERLLEACPDGIIANDRKGRIILYNSGAEQLLGYPRSEALAGFPVQRLYPGDEAREIKRALLSEDHGGRGILVDYNTRTMASDGKIIPIRLSATILYDQGDEFAIAGYFHDLTELEEHMSALSQANARLNAANRELGRLNRYYLDMLSFVTHELKSPIANGYMSANALRQEIFGSLAPEQAVMVEATCRNLDQSMEMIRHYLDLSRIEKDEFLVKPQPTRLLEEVIEPVLTALSSTIADRGARIELEVASDFDWLLDPELFRGVITNLVSNAVKYGERNGIIRIAARSLGASCRLEVWNSGAGLAPADLGQLFKKFQRLPSSRKSTMRGTGLGLFITKTVVERHGGRIWVESEQGAWVNFLMELPKDAGTGATGADQGRDGA